MVYTITDIEKILAYKTWKSQKIIDTLLQMDCKMYCHLGIDSTKQEKADVKKASRKIYQAIKTINTNLGNLFLQQMDSNKTKEPL